jgi:hypothetical protein
MMNLLVKLTKGIGHKFCQLMKSSPINTINSHSIMMILINNFNREKRAHKGIPSVNDYQLLTKFCSVTVLLKPVVFVRILAVSILLTSVCISVTYVYLLSRDIQK